MGDAQPDLPRYPQPEESIHFQGQSGSPGRRSPNRRNPRAVASLVCACCAILPLIGAVAAIAAITLGVIARRQIDQSNGAQSGTGMALAGIILGSLFLAAELALLVFAIVHGHFHGRHPFHHLFRHL